MDLHIWTYARLIGYPLLALSIIILACEGCRRFRSRICKVHILLALLFMGLWGHAMITLVHKGLGGGAAHDFNTYVITPILFACIIYVWYAIIKNCEDRKKRDLESGRMECPE